MDDLIIDKRHQYVNILDRVKTIAAHHKQLTHAKGELFNIYSILNFQTKEVRTHSAFIAELLNPIGTHLMGNVFLEVFLSFLPKNLYDHLDQETVKVYIEFFIGTINKKLKTGGRIDILLVDQFGASICIENKIDAGDQEEQIERYCNYNKGKNQVIYLSKFGEEPNISSKGELMENNDFYVISYQNHIINWLETCQKIAFDQPILRESIKQYKILIQKITNTLGDKQDKELKAVVINNLEEASLIATKYSQVINEIKDNFRNTILELLKHRISGFALEKMKGVDRKYANIWFYSDTSNQNERWFVVENFSGIGHLNGALFMGVFDKKGISLGQEYNALNKNWIHHQVIKYDNIDVNLSESQFLEKINSPGQLEIVAKEISELIISFLEENRNLINN